jgi:predicted anti-sigma-YlaC factor YlaD
MECKEVRNGKGLLFLYQELSPAEGRALAAHLASCSGCQAHMEQLKQTLAMVRHLETPEPAGYVLANLRLAADRSFPPRAGWWPRLKNAWQLPVLPLPRWAAVSAVTLASVVLVVGLYLAPFRQADPAILTAIENGLDDQVVALTDQVEVMEWELYEAGGVAVLDDQLDELEDLVDNTL